MPDCSRVDQNSGLCLSFSEHPAAEQILARPYQLQPQKVEGEVERMLGAAGWIVVAAPAYTSMYNYM